jgi:hypothetical protein
MPFSGRFTKRGFEMDEAYGPSEGVLVALHAETSAERSAMVAVSPTAKDRASK